MNTRTLILHIQYSFLYYISIKKNVFYIVFCVYHKIWKGRNFCIFCVFIYPPILIPIPILFLSLSIFLDLIFFNYQSILVYIFYHCFGVIGFMNSRHIYEFQQCNVNVSTLALPRSPFIINL